MAAPQGFNRSSVLFPPYIAVWFALHTTDEILWLISWGVQHFSFSSDRGLQRFGSHSQTQVSLHWRLVAIMWNATKLITHCLNPNLFQCFFLRGWNDYKACINMHNHPQCKLQCKKGQLVLLYFMHSSKCVSSCALKCTEIGKNFAGHMFLSYIICNIWMTKMYDILDAYSVILFYFRAPS